MAGTAAKTGIVAAVAGALVALGSLRPAAQSDDAGMKRSVAELATFPAELAGWRGVDDPLDPEVVRRAEAAGALSRRYTDAATGQSVAMLILVGEPGPLGAHTPEVCYGGSGYRPVTPPAKWDAAGGALWRARFRADSFPPRELSVTWAWGRGDWWSASESPRWEYARWPWLLKVYLSCAPAREGSPDAAQLFWPPLADELRRRFGSSSSVAPGHE